jgi:hypothetical protein
MPRPAAQPGDDEEGDHEQEEDRAYGWRHSARPGIAERRARYQRRVEPDSRLACIPVSERRRDQKKPATVVLPLEIRDCRALDITGDPVGDKPLHATAGFYADPSLVGRQQDDHARVSIRIARGTSSADPPVAPNPERDVGNVEAAEVGQRYHRHFAACARANRKGNPVQPIDRRRVQHACRINHDLGG